MSIKTGTIIASMIGAVALGIGGYFANEWRLCDALKEDYRSFAIGLMADRKVAGIMGSSDFDKLMKRKTDQEVGRAAQTLVDLGDRCGAAAAANAQAEAQALVLGIDDL